MQTYSKQGYLYKRSSTFLGAVEILRGFPNPQVRKDFQRPRCACGQHIGIVFSDYKSSRRERLNFSPQRGNRKRAIYQNAQFHSAQGITLERWGILTFDPL